VAGVLQDLQATFDGPPTTEGIGDVTEAVFVKRPRQQQTGGNGHGAGDQGGRQMPQARSDATGGRPDQRSCQWEPHDDAL
jgi:hypothetical protein